MKCPNCRKEMTVQAGAYPYQESGLDVTLLGVDIGRCEHCGETCVTIPDMEGLHYCLALMLVKRKGRLTGSEVRFLRTFVGWSGKTFAEAISVDPSTVSRWESGKQQIGLQASALLRALVLMGKKERNYFESHDSAPPDNLLPFRLRVSGKKWKPDPEDDAPGSPTTRHALG